MTDVQVTQAGNMAVGSGTSSLRVTQLGTMVLGAVGADINVDQAGVMVLGAPPPSVRVSQAGAMVLAELRPCVTRECQLWTITRKDGRVLRFTSLDADFVDADDITYLHCKSLEPSASESTAVNSAGDVELKGVIDNDAISEDDLLAGLYDDAYVEIWLVPWNGAESRKRLAAGWLADLERGDTGFRMSILGPGTRLEQKALIEVVTPSCTHELGDGADGGPGQCMFDIEAAKRFGIVNSALDRGQFNASLETTIFSAESSGVDSSDDGGLFWANGFVRWTLGRNAGQITEVKSVDWGTGEIVLWALTGFLPEAGDEFEILPGCPKDPAACQVYDQIANYGGFPHVPGQDQINQTPDAKY